MQFAEMLKQTYTPSFLARVRTLYFHSVYTLFIHSFISHSDIKTTRRRRWERKLCTVYTIEAMAVRGTSIVKRIGRSWWIKDNSPLEHSPLLTLTARIGSHLLANSSSSSISSVFLFYLLSFKFTFFKCPFEVPRKTTVKSPVDVAATAVSKTPFIVTTGRSMTGSPPPSGVLTSRPQKSSPIVCSF